MVEAWKGSRASYQAKAITSKQASFAFVSDWVFFLTKVGSLKTFIIIKGTSIYA